MKPCEACIVGKLKQNCVSKNSDHNPDKGNSEQIFINIPNLKEERDGPPVQSKQQLRIMVDEKTNLKFAKFFSKNNEMIEPT